MRVAIGGWAGARVWWREAGLTEAEVVTQSGDTGAEEEVGRERGEERREERRAKAQWQRRGDMGTAKKDTIDAGSAQGVVCRSSDARRICT
jgi:hypothetical protein